MKDNNHANSLLHPPMRNAAPVPDWCRPKQAAARQRLEENGLCRRANDDWRHSDPGTVYRQAWQHATQVPYANDVGTSALAAERLQNLNCQEWFTINGQSHGALLDTTDGAHIMRFSKMSKAQGGAAQAFFGAHLEPRYDFATLNTACMRDGCMVSVADEQQLSRPVHLCSLAITEPSGPSFAFHPRHLLMLGKDSTATIIDSYTGIDTDSRYLNNAVTEIHLGAGSRLHYYRVQQESAKAFHVGHTVVHQEQDSQLHMSCVSLGSAWARTELHCQLAASGAELQARGLYLASGRQHTDHHIHVEHRAPHTRSNLHYRGVLDDRGHGVFTGKIQVHRDAQAIQSQQMNANLLLSDHAEIDTRPELLIYANDVQCGHGATVTRIDEDLLFYLRARALAEDSARRLLCSAFLKTLMDQLGLPPLQQRIEQQLGGWLAPHPI